MHESNILKRLVSQFKSLKGFVVGLVLGLTLVAGSVFAWNAVWHGTDWIQSGAIIPANKVAENFEYLKHQVGTLSADNTSGGAKIVRCTNAESADPNNTVCYGAAHPTPNSPYRALNCLGTEQATYGALTGDNLSFYSGKWHFDISRDTSYWLDCENGTVLVANMSTIQPTSGSIPDFDTGWFDVARHCQTYEFNLGFSGLPKDVTAYEKLKSDGTIMLYGHNQYGDAWQTNGAIIDFNENGKMWVREPCNSTWNTQVMHLGEYRNRNNTGNVDYYNIPDGQVQMRVMIWK